MNFRIFAYSNDLYIGDDLPWLFVSTQLVKIENVVYHEMQDLAQFDVLGSSISWVRRHESFSFLKRFWEEIALRGLQWCIFDSAEENGENYYRNILCIRHWKPHHKSTTNDPNQAKIKTYLLSYAKNKKKSLHLKKSLNGIFCLNRKHSDIKSSSNMF